MGPVVLVRLHVFLRSRNCFCSLSLWHLCHIQTCSGDLSRCHLSFVLKLQQFHRTLHCGIYLLDLFIVHGAPQIVSVGSRGRDDFTGVMSIKRHCHPWASVLQSPWPPTPSFALPCFYGQAYENLCDSLRCPIRTQNTLEGEGETPARVYLAVLQGE